MRLPVDTFDEQSRPLWETRWPWSLWEMINFRFSGAHFILSELNILISTSNRNAEFVTHFGRHSDQVVNDPNASKALKDCRTGAESVADMAQRAFVELGCQHINVAAERLLRWAKRDDDNWSELNTRARALRDAIDTELKEYYYFQYPKHEGRAVLLWEKEWAAVIERFPDAKPEIFGAVDLHALGHHPASVFYCMCVLEHGLGALADSVGLSFDVQQWNTIIEQIESKISEARKTLLRGAEKNERMQFLSEAAKEFFYFKDGWRNNVGARSECHPSASLE